MNQDIKVAIVGLGRVGTSFLKRLYEYRDRGVSIVAVTEKNAASPGLEYARLRSIGVYDDMSDITAFGKDVDVVFNLTGDQSVERSMRLSQVKMGNHRTIIVSTVMASLMWRLISEEALPQHTFFTSAADSRPAFI